MRYERWIVDGSMAVADDSNNKPGVLFVDVCDMFISSMCMCVNGDDVAV